MEGRELISIFLIDVVYRDDLLARLELGHWALEPKREQP